MDLHFNTNFGRSFYRFLVHRLISRYPGEDQHYHFLAPNQGQQQALCFTGSSSASHNQQLPHESSFFSCLNSIKFVQHFTTSIIRRSVCCMGASVISVLPTPLTLVVASTLLLCAIALHDQIVLFWVALHKLSHILGILPLLLLWPLSLARISVKWSLQEEESAKADLKLTGRIAVKSMENLTGSATI